MRGKYARGCRRCRQGAGTGHPPEDLPPQHHRPPHAQSHPARLAKQPPQGDVPPPAIHDEDRPVLIPLCPRQCPDNIQLHGQPLFPTHPRPTHGLQQTRDAADRHGKSHHMPTHTGATECIKDEPTALQLEKKLIINAADWSKTHPRCTSSMSLPHASMTKMGMTDPASGQAQ